MRDLIECANFIRIENMEIKYIIFQHSRYHRSITFLSMTFIDDD